MNYEGLLMDGLAESCHLLRLGVPVHILANIVLIHQAFLILVELLLVHLLRNILEWNMLLGNSL